MLLRVLDQAFFRDDDHIGDSERTASSRYVTKMVTPAPSTFRCESKTQTPVSNDAVAAPPASRSGRPGHRDGVGGRAHLGGPSQLRSAPARGSAENCRPDRRGAGSRA